MLDFYVGKGFIFGTVYQTTDLYGGTGFIFGTVYQTTDFYVCKGFMFGLIPFNTVLVSAVHVESLI